MQSLLNSSYPYLIQSVSHRKESNVSFISPFKYTSCLRITAAVCVCVCHFELKTLLNIWADAHAHQQLGEQLASNFLNDYVTLPFSC